MASITCVGFLVFFQCDLPPPPAPVVVCPQAHVWSKQYQAKLAHELAAQPKGSALRQAMREHIQLRDRLGECGNGSKWGK